MFLREINEKSNTFMSQTYKTIFNNFHEMNLKKTKEKYLIIV